MTDEIMPAEDSGTMAGRAESINAAHRIAMAAATTGVMAFLEVGRQLCEAKAEGKRRGRYRDDRGRERNSFRWGDWVDSNLTFGRDQARHYMNSHEERRNLLTSGRHFLGLHSAREYLANGRAAPDDDDDEDEHEDVIIEDLADDAEDVADDAEDVAADDKGVAGDGGHEASGPGPVASEEGRKQLLDGLRPFDRYFSLVKESGGIVTLLRTWPREDREVYCEVVRRFGDKFHAIARAIEEMT